MRVLVTGHAGYIGTVLVPMLQRAGHEVTGLDSFLYEDCGIGPAPSEPPAIRKDTRDVTVEDLRGFDAVVDLAAISNDPLGDLNPDTTYAINHRAPARLAALAKEAGVSKFVYSSSCSLYGAHGDSYIDESADFLPVTPYGESKVLSERDISALADDNFSPTFMRNATAYGVSPRLRGDLVVNNLTGYAVAIGEVLLKSDGTPWRPLVHIEDISRVALAILEAPTQLVHNEAFNVGATAENYRIRDVAEIVHGVVPDSIIGFGPNAGPDKRNYRVDCDKLASLLPHAVPQWTVETGAEQLRDLFQAVGLTREQLEGGGLQRLKHVRAEMGAGRLDDSLRWVLSRASRVAS
ncbi:NAD-dependent epimerase/dehydratase family protein [Euzebya tangerina]|uniref:NAD-dependent epimerase/dehydratase family protein n=1 Tax=Euzebya tangerina TaxID=591198 RepID=UPI000E3153D4|nr:SDR family oxidoreductase [Euzebya tangerina]